MIVSINQPAYLPWLGYFHRIAVSDLHIVLDHVQFEKNSFTNRNKIRTADGWCWLTVPVSTSGRFGAAINSLEIAAGRAWAGKHWASIQMNYAKAPFFSEHAGFFEGLFHREWRMLNPLLRELTAYLLDAFGIRTPLLFSSEMNVLGTKSELVLNLCRAVGATRYLSGPLGRNYLDEDSFAAAGIEVEYHAYKHSQYPQVYSGFEPFMAAIDLLFNWGPRSLDILKHEQGNAREVLLRDRC